MSPQLIEAIRKEAFVQGIIHGRAVERGVDLKDVADEVILGWIVEADRVFIVWRKKRTS